ncbi:hypothetical protein [Aegicerativicinus sediminis]|uniref:hypothetical protein n=1 Tax=Aegicerativicinus sediminis TaxID=2893202 RepID=UPI001E58E5C1|nr:hypothetical protein [Aegicerativicinus sediminis]
MKSLIIIWILGFMTLSGCTQKANVDQLLDNPDTREEIFEAIVGNHNQMMLFMETMQSNEHAMQMMQGNQMMMGNMMKGDGMHMMMTDSVMMHNMMEKMMANKSMMGSMMQMMNENGMMTDECMQHMIHSMNGMENMKQ